MPRIFRVPHGAIMLRQTHRLSYDEIIDERCVLFRFFSLFIFFVSLANKIRRFFWACFGGVFVCLRTPDP